MKAAGYVYVQTNDAKANEVVVYRRNDDGRLDRLGSYLTGGRGSGEPHLPSQSSIVALDGRVIVTNAGSDDVTVFAVDGDGLTIVDRAPSGGAAPRSVAVRGDYVYVLNAGGRSVTGFRFADDELAPIDGGTFALANGADPAQVAFSPDGFALLVTDRASDAIHVLRLDDSRAVAGVDTIPSSGATPYGFDIRRDGTVVVTEAARAEAGKASASSYRLGNAAQLDVVSGAVGNTRSEVCWAVIANGGRTAFVTNFADGTISSYAIGEDGSIVLRDPVAATTVDGMPGIRDEALSADGRFLYALHADTGQVFGWKVEADGTLVAVGSANGLPLTAAGLAAN
jgi:6-phosphogluconolactonase (cycloisomerase 2 family)